MAVLEDGACEARVVHGAKLAALAPLMPDDDRAQAEADRFRALGDPTRLRILLALSLSELCVCDLGALLGSAQPAVSQHLKVLRTLDMVRYRKQGRMAFYRLADRSLLGALARLAPPAGGGTEERRSV